MTAKTVEDLLNDQLAACVAATQDCLAQSRLPQPDDIYGHRRRNDVAYVAKLMKASARLTEALAQLRGDTRHNIHVTRGAADTGDKG
jgi:delta 1-pyrroline-5-carboxylate dehydrogenase